MSGVPKVDWHKAGSVQIAWGPKKREKTFR